MKLYKIKNLILIKKVEVFTLQKILKKEQKIIDYVGKLITKKQTEDSDKYDNSKPIYLLQLITVMTLMETLLGIQQD
jgi:hypothetical protein